ncbi:flavin-containing monooxygenase [Streptomyces zingiberis]|uniref:NAD(P)-binding domain-containing protein n=1 Tax=Streptomyces zingiberis TaxID=2053010 RepID=A0ABX1BR81_9ACTN|nr:FAD-dependent oxidoreductase [Streptomyces zingiberis]NJQ00196.1 NAD(P)-binding domain-containing protein [Streptomyces zingiberis]
MPPAAPPPAPSPPPSAGLSLPGGPPPVPQPGDAGAGPRTAPRRSALLPRAGRSARIAVIGAGPAGLTSAKQALAEGHEVVVYERNADVGGVWDPGSGGAYPGVRMQHSRMSLPFSDFPPERVADFPTLPQVHAYLRAYAERFGVLARCRFGHRVARVARRAGGGWRVTAERDGHAPATEEFDAVLVAVGELWEPRLPDRMPGPGAAVRVWTAKSYRGPEGFAGRRTLVVGGGVSGADIAAELSDAGARVDWSLRTRPLFLPRDCGGVYNDALFSYAGRIALEELPYRDYLEWLGDLLPEYMAMYRETGLLPRKGFHGAVHINDKVIPRVYRGRIRPRPAFGGFTPDGAAVLTDGTTRTERSYDDVVLCLGYAAPDHGFIEDFRPEDLYGHHVHRRDPTLAVIGVPAGAEGFGAACPYVEAVAGWVLAVLGGRAELPDAAGRAAWCERTAAGSAARAGERAHLDCWLETVRMGLAAGTLPDPHTRFAAYWRLVSGTVAPSRLRPEGPAVPRPAAFDGLVDLDHVRHRILAALPLTDRDTLLATAEIGREDYEAALSVPPGRELPPWLPYRRWRASRPPAAVPG